MKRNKPTIFGHQAAEIRNIPIFAPFLIKTSGGAVRLTAAEIIPIEPDADYADEGNSDVNRTTSPPYPIFIDQL